MTTTHLQATIERRTLTLAPGRPYVVGTGPGSDVRIAASGFAGDILRIRHLEHWTVQVLGSPQIVEVDGRATAERLVHVWPHASRRLTIRSGAGRLTARFEAMVAGTAPAARSPSSSSGARIEHPLGERTTFGRRGCDVLVPGLAVALHHATLVRRTQTQYQLYDTGLGGGTFVDGRPVMWARRDVGQSFTIGNSVFTIEAEGLLVERRQPVAVTMAIRGLSACHRGGLALYDVTLDLGARDVLAVLGPSGAGKTSLFKAIVGEIEIVAGSVAFRDLDLVAHTDQVRPMLGYVPQQDHLHLTLTSRQVLDYAARLRLPADMARGERAALVAEVARSLGIADRLGERAASLSGGERKRLSIGMEVIGQPSLLMLDEPTSGLDPGTTREVMRQLRGIADRDCTVALTTHSTDQLEGVDHMLVLAPGGRCAFVGQPEEALPTLRAANYADLMVQLRTAPAPPAMPPRPAPRRRTSTARATGPAARPVPPTRRGARRLRTLMAREFALLRARGWLGLLTYLAVPVLGTWLAVTRAAGDGLGGRSLSNPHALQTLSLLVTTVVFAGQALTYGNLVAEYQLLRRERRTGVSATVAVVAKFIVFGLVAIGQATLVAGAFFLFRPEAPASLLGLDGRVEVGATLILTTIAAMALGLLISACARSLEWAVGLASAAAVCQVAMNGVLIELARWSPLAAMSLVLPARWGVAAGAAVTDVLALTPGLQSDPLWQHSSSRLLTAWAMLGALSIVSVGLACAVLSRRIRADTS